MKYLLLTAIFFTSNIAAAEEVQLQSTALLECIPQQANQIGIRVSSLNGTLHIPGRPPANGKHVEVTTLTWNPQSNIWEKNVSAFIPNSEAYVDKTNRQFTFRNGVLGTSMQSYIRVEVDEDKVIVHFQSPVMSNNGPQTDYQCTFL